MLRRAFTLLVGAFALAGCTAGYQPARYSGAPAVLSPTALGQGAPGAPAGRGVALLLPLSGTMGDLAHAMQQAAQLALDTPGAPRLDVKDTGGTPDGAAAAARAAIADGVGLILGPLTSTETAAVAPVARAANVPVLAFTNDPAQAQPGVWTLGITPAQQVRRMVAAAQAQSKTRFAALLPENDFGRVMGDALTQATSAQQLPPPDIRQYSPGMASINQTVRDLSGYASRRGPIDAQIRAARAQQTPEGRKQSQELMRSSIPPPPFDALLLADTGESLTEIAAMLPYYDIDRGAVQVLGPALWASPGSGSGQMSGAWYAAPDPASRGAFVQAYSDKYGAPPLPLADLAYDAAAISRVAASQGGYSPAALTQPAGFAGVDGWLALQADGHVRRGLAVFQIQRGGPQMVEPAPATPIAPGT